MKKNSKLIILIILLVTVVLGMQYNSKKFFYNNISRESKDVLSYYGSRGQEVINIQTKLKQWGYYTGAVDGIFGSQTYQAVRRFQTKNGLAVDGIVGTKTLAALGLPTGDSATAATTTSTSKDVNILARIIHGEARGESYTGKVAVGAVILNRVQDSRFPKTIAGVIYQPGAFDAVADGQINLAPDSTSIKAARDALNGWDPTYGCVYYWNPATATSKWIWSRPIITQIGKHVFAK